MIAACNFKKSLPKHCALWRLGSIPLHPDAVSVAPTCLKSGNGPDFAPKEAVTVPPYFILLFTGVNLDNIVPLPEQAKLSVGGVGSPMASDQEKIFTIKELSEHLR